MNAGPPPSQPPAGEPATRPHPRPYLALALVCLPIFLGALDLTVVSAVLPHVVYDLEIPLQTGLDDAAWLVSGYLLAYTVAMTFMGRLSDRVGRGRVYLLSLATFAVGSLWVATANGLPARWLSIGYRSLLGARPDPALVDLWALIAGRVVQAIGAGAMVPVSMALVADLFPPQRRAGPLGLVGAVDTAGWVVGHLYGGIVVRYFDWRLVFWLNLPICAVAFVLIALALRGLNQPRAPGRFDWIGALLIGSSLTALTVGLGGGGELGTSAAFGSQAPPALSVPLLALSALVLVLFLVWEARHPNPLIPLAWLRQRNFAAAGAANWLAGFALVIAIANVPLFINTLVAVDLQQGAWDSGWMLSGLTLPMAAAALLGGWLTARVGYRATTLPGLALAMAGFGLMTTWRPDTPYAVMLAHLALAGVGFGLVITPIATAVVNAAAPAERGGASALVIILRLSGMTVGLAAMTTFGLQRADHLLREWLPVGAATTDDLISAGMRAANQVIGETFLIAAAACAVALLPALLLRSEPRAPSSP